MMSYFHFPIKNQLYDKEIVLSFYEKNIFNGYKIF